MRFNSNCIVVSVSALLVVAAPLCVNGAPRGAVGDSRTPESSLSRTDEQSRRQLMEDNNNSGGDNGGGGSLTETRPCVPFEQVPQYIFDHERSQASSCLTNTCPNGCCRLFSWTACDEDDEFPILQCICNENTATPAPQAAPTLAPTAATDSPTVTPIPTRSPSFSPTSSPPTITPTQSPTVSPAPTGPLPTISPSASPTVNPTTSPTQIPTDRPSASPSASPTTSSPTSDPTLSPTDSPTITPFTTEDTTFEGAQVRQSTCLETPPLPQFTQKTTFAFTYEVYVIGGATTTADVATQQSIVDTSLNDLIHDAIARTFLKCQFTDGANEPDLWILQSAPQDVDETSSCRGWTFAEDACFVVQATETIYVYDFASGGGGGGTRKGRRQLQEDAVATFITDINTFVNNEMAAGTFNVDPDYKLGYINDGSNPIVTSVPTTSPSVTPTALDPPVGALDSSDFGNDVQGAIGGGTEQAVEEDDGLPVAGIAALIAACVVVLIVVMLAVTRSRRNRRERQLEYLEKADLDLVDQVNTTMEDHLELDSNEGYDLDGIGVVRSSPSYDDQYGEDAFTSTSASMNSPSRRSQRGPLHSQDELDKVVGNHRGGPNSSSSARSKRGRVYMAKDTVDL